MRPRTKIRLLVQSGNGRFQLRTPHWQNKSMSVRKTEPGAYSPPLTSCQNALSGLIMLGLFPRMDESSRGSLRETEYETCSQLIKPQVQALLRPKRNDDVDTDCHMRLSAGHVYSIDRRRADGGQAYRCLDVY